MQPLIDLRKHAHEADRLQTAIERVLMRVSQWFT